VLLAGAEWTAAHLEDAPSAVAEALLAALADTCGALGVDLPRPEYAAAHRWRHALPARDGGASSAFDGPLRLGMAGDWMRGPRVEDAYLSGVALAGRVLGASVRASRATVSA
jgi:hypothetical protein